MRKLKAITLLETIIYLAVFGVMFIAVIEYVFSVADNNLSANAENSADKQIILINEHLTQTFKDATVIDVNNCIFDDDNGILNLTTPTGSIIYSISGGRLRVSVDGVNSYLSDDNFNLTKLRITRIDSMDSTGIGAKVNLLLESVSDTSITRNLDTSYVL